MESKFTVSNKHDLEFFLHIIMLGSLTALSSEKITTNDIQKIIFRYGIIEYLERLMIDEKYLEILHLGTELEDIESLIPEQLNGEITKLINLLLNNLSELNLSDNILMQFKYLDNQKQV